MLRERQRDTKGLEDSLRITLEPLQWKNTQTLSTTISAARPECTALSNTDLEHLTLVEGLKAKPNLSYATNARIFKIFFSHFLHRTSRLTYLFMLWCCCVLCLRHIFCLLCGGFRDVMKQS